MIPRTPTLTYDSAKVSTVHPGDIEAIVQVRHSLASADRRFSTALVRFDYSAERSRTEDRLIDAVIALEALLLPGIKQEQRFRFSLNGALVLGDSADVRLRWQASLRTVYDVRSALVHGDYVPANRVREGLEIADEALRGTLGYYLKTSMSFDEWQLHLQQLALK